MEDEGRVRTSKDVKKYIQISKFVTIAVKSFEEPKNNLAEGQLKAQEMQCR